MWVLRFNNGVTSAGFAIDAEQFPLATSLSVEQEWRSWLNRYPSVRGLFERAEVVDPPGRLIRSGILPRRAARAAGDDWALLPHTAGFVDPLHSTGIAHSLCGVERLMNIFLTESNTGGLGEALHDYERAVFGELVLMDRLVHGCYRALADFRLFVAYSMLYFAAATRYEQQRMRTTSGQDHWFLCADDHEFCRMVEAFHSRVVSLGSRRRQASSAEIESFETDLATSIRPYDHVGLCDPEVRNMYRYTATS